VQDPRRDQDERSLATTIVTIWSPNRSAACAGGVSGSAEAKMSKRPRGRPIIWARGAIGEVRNSGPYHDISSEKIARPMISSASR
jgi:hypothetical protein